MNPLVTKRCSPIEEMIYQDGFQAGATSRDAEIAKLKEQNWELISEKAPALVAVRKERNQLRAQINALTSALNKIAEELRAMKEQP